MKFSIVIPSWNRAHLLPRCLESVFRQTYSDFEIIVADDGSTDSTADLVTKLASERCPNLRYIPFSNSGAATTRNRGAATATGEFLIFLDSDDEVVPHWLSRLAETLEKKKVDVVCCGCQTFDPSGKMIAERLPVEPSPGRRYRCGQFLAGTFAVRRDLFERLGGYVAGLPANHHSELRMRLLQLCEKENRSLACIQEPLVLVHEHDGPKVRKNVRAVYESGVYILERHGHLLREHPASFADWATAVGGCAARLGNYREARRWFIKAIGAFPRGLKNYARIVLTVSPLLRSAVWRRVTT